MIHLRLDMEEVFDPVVNDILHLVGQQVDNVSQSKGKRINVGLKVLGDFARYINRHIDKPSVDCSCWRLRKLGLSQAEVGRLVRHSRQNQMHPA